MPNAEMIEISVDDVSLKVASDVKVTQIFAGQSVDMTGVGPSAIVVCKINGVLRDLWSDVAAGDVVEGGITLGTNQARVERESLLHSPETNLDRVQPSNAVQSHLSDTSTTRHCK